MTELDQSVMKARNKLLAMLGAHIILDAVLVAIAKDIWAIGRISVTILVMYFTLQGRKWAKWLLIGILSFLVVALITLVVVLHSKLSTILIVGSLILTVLSVIILIYLIFNQDLNRYFLAQRQAASKDVT